MLEIILASVLSSLIIFAYGNFFYSILFSRKYVNIVQNSEKSLMGIVFLTFLAILINFFLPLTKEICSIIFLVGIILFFNKKIFFDYSLILITSLITLTLVSYSYINRPDAGLYHIPLINMINENKIILGSANIHFRFAHGSIVQNFSSLYNIYFFNISFITISIASVFSFFLYFIYEKINYLLKKKKKILFIAYLITFVFFIYSFNRYSGYGNDAIAHLYFIYLVLIMLSLNLKNKISHDELFKIILISFFLIGLKLFMVLTVVIPFLLFIKIRDKTELFKKKAFYVCVVFAVSILIKSFLTSGCIFYPIQKSCFSSLKIYNEKQLISTASMSEAWSKGWPDQKKKVKNYDIFNEDFNWIKTWKENHLIYIIKKIIPYLVIMSFIFTFIYFYSVSTSNREKPKNDISTLNIFIILSFVTICCVTWFLKFPLYRFGLSFLYCLFLLIFLVLLKKIINRLSIKKMKILSFTLILLSLTGFLGKNLNRIISESSKGSQIWPNVLINEKFEKVDLSNKGFYYFSNGKECMYGYSPCTYYKTENLKFKKVYNYKIYWLEN